MRCIQNPIAVCSTCCFGLTNRSNDGKTFAGRLVVAVSIRLRTFCLDHQPLAQTETR